VRRAVSSMPGPTIFAGQGREQPEEACGKGVRYGKYAEKFLGRFVSNRRAPGRRVPVGKRDWHDTWDPFWDCSLYPGVFVPLLGGDVPEVVSSKALGLRRKPGQTQESPHQGRYGDPSASRPGSASLLRVFS